MSWHIAVGERVRDKNTPLVIEAKKCVLGCTGKMARLAHRQVTEPYAWIPIGYHCVTCNTLYYDDQITAVDM